MVFFLIRIVLFSFPSTGGLCLFFWSLRPYIFFLVVDFLFVLVHFLGLSEENSVPGENPHVHKHN